MPVKDGALNQIAAVWELVTCSGSLFAVAGFFFQDSRSSKRATDFGLLPLRHVAYSASGEASLALHKREPFLSQGKQAPALPENSVALRF
jgi:hypothetical protein